MSYLASEKCSDCRGAASLGPAAARELLRELHGWRITSGNRLERELRFPDFAAGLAFVNQVGDLAEQQGHHPDLFLSWGKVRVTLWTHSAGGLTRSDFVLAAKIDQLASGGSASPG